MTTLLEAIRARGPGAFEQLVGLVYDELRRLSSQMLRHERPGHTLQKTALLHEVLLRLVRPDSLAAAQERAQFIAAAARAMRQVLVDHARQRGAAKLGDGRARLPLDQVLDDFAEQRLDVPALHEALGHLAG